MRIFDLRAANSEKGKKSLFFKLKIFNFFDIQSQNLE